MPLKKIVIASNAFKGSLTSSEVADAAERGIKDVLPDCEVVKTSIADGGDGTARTLTAAKGGKMVSVTVNDPLMRPIKAEYGIAGDTAVIEMSAASGLALLSHDERDPMNTTTYGTGEMILDALSRGCRNILIGIGGSATNDAATGILQALGFRFIDGNGKEPGKGGRILSEIGSIDGGGLIPEAANVRFTVGYDVRNPFYGTEGAAYVYAPQKGADDGTVKILDGGLRNFAEVIKRYNGTDVTRVEGAGAAGGAGGALKALLGADLVQGIDMVLEAVKFDETIKDADLIITGEGKLDTQTAMGKAPYGVLRAGSRYGIPVVVLAGSAENTENIKRLGFREVYVINPQGISPETAMNPLYAKERVRITVADIVSRLAVV